MPAGRVAFLWTIHEGMRGTTELEVTGDGRVCETRSLPSATIQDLPAKEIGRVSPEDVRALAETIDRSRFEEIRASAPASPDMTMITLDVQLVGQGARAEFPASDAGRPGITEVRDAFLRLRKRAETQPFAPPKSNAAPPQANAAPAQANAAPPQANAAPPQANAAPPQANAAPPPIPATPVRAIAAARLQLKG